MRLHALASLSLAALLPGIASAQDNNYWTLQYGNQARLLGGAVIGSASDLSAVYYNPGRLALTEQSEFVIAGNVLEFTSTDLESQGTDRNSGKTRFSLSPSLFAGELKFDFLGSGRLAYSFLTRQYSDLRLQASFIDPDGGLLTEYTGDLASIDHRLSEYWTGFTYANKLGGIGLGASMFVTTRSHRTGAALESIDIGDDAIVLQTVSRGYDYSHWGLLWKVGAGTTLQDWDVGLTVTTPRMKLFGSGDLYDSEARVDQTGALPDHVLVTVQNDLSTTYKSPWSVALGGSNTFGNNSVHVGVEWFAPLSGYSVLDGVPQAPQVGAGAPLDPDLVAATGSVVNFAVGFERREHERLRWYASLHSDFAAEDTEDASNLAFTAWDLWHLGGGASFKVGTTELTLGAIYAFGGTETAGAFQNTLRSRMQRVTLILGFNLPFGNPTAG